MAIEILTGLLVLVTGVYVYLTHKAVNEAREARLQALRPHIAVDFWPLGPTYPILRITNAGMAVALDVDVDVTIEPQPTDDNDPPERFEFRFMWSAVQVGANHQIGLPDAPKGSGRSTLDVMLEDYGPVTVSGSCRDILGREHHVDTTLDFREWWAAIGTRHELRNPAPTDQVAQQVQGIAKQLEAIAKG